MRNIIGAGLILSAPPCRRSRRSATQKPPQLVNRNPVISPLRQHMSFRDFAVSHPGGRGVLPNPHPAHRNRKGYAGRQPPHREGKAREIDFYRPGNTRSRFCCICPNRHPDSPDAHAKDGRNRHPAVARCHARQLDLRGGHLARRHRRRVARHCQRRRLQLHQDLRRQAHHQRRRNPRIQSLRPHPSTTSNSAAKSSCSTASPSRPSTPKPHNSSKLSACSSSRAPRAAATGTSRSTPQPDVASTAPGIHGRAFPASAAYAATFQQFADFDDIAKQFLLMDGHVTRDLGVRSAPPRLGRAPKSMPWADKANGLSPEVWARAMGWYVMALVDVLD